MTFSNRTRHELFAMPKFKNEVTTSSFQIRHDQVIRLPQAQHQSTKQSKSKHAPQTQQTSMPGPPWTQDEHERFLEGLELFPSGPWKEVARIVGTKTTRQTMTHAQKYRQKIARHKRGLLQSVRKVTNKSRKRNDTGKKQSISSPSPVKTSEQCTLNQSESVCAAEIISTIEQSSMTPLTNEEVVKTPFNDFDIDLLDMMSPEAIDATILSLSNDPIDPNLMSYVPSSPLSYSKLLVDNHADMVVMDELCSSTKIDTMYPFTKVFEVHL